VPPCAEFACAAGNELELANIKIFLVKAGMSMTIFVKHLILSLIMTMIVGCGVTHASDLQDVKTAGVLRHLGIPYANFVTGSDDGMDVEIIKGFARQLGVRYEYVKADWGTVVEDLIGRKVSMVNNLAVLGEKTPVRGDLIANGFTVLPWREDIIDSSLQTFPSKIWLVARADSPLKPIRPSKSEAKDIERTRSLLKNRKVLTLPKTCLDPNLYNLESAGAIVITHSGKLNEIAPTLINKEAEMSILDVPDALIALEKWPGKIKIIGPISTNQIMAVGFPKTSPRLREAFNKYLLEIKRNGTYLRLVKKYYPTASYYFPDFFRKIAALQN
jgi:ABC-type amino acid transport substrate-binding protein